MKRKSTKYQMVFQPIGIMEQMKLRFEQWRGETGGFTLKKVFIPKKEYQEYKNWVLATGGGNYWYQLQKKLYYRGAEVLPL